MSALEPALRALAAELRVAVPAAAPPPGDDVRAAAFAVGLRLRRVRIRRRRWWRQDHGPLLARETVSGAWAALLPGRTGGTGMRGADGRIRPLGAARAAEFGAEFFMPYPRWPAGPATARRWLDLARPRGDGAALRWLLSVGAALPPVVPALAALAFGAAARSSGPLVLAILVCLTLGGALAGWAAALARLRRDRDGNLRLHALLWDGLLSANPAGLRRFPRAALAVRLREALSGAQHAIEESDQLREAGCALAAALLVLAAAAPPLAGLCALELLAAAALLHRLWSAVGAATLALGERVPRLEQTLDLTARAMPGFRAFGAAGWLLGETGRALAAVLAAGSRGERAALRARGAGRLVFLLQPLVIGAASAAGLAGSGFSLSGFAGALLSACAAAAAAARIGAVTGTRRVRQERIAAVTPLLAAGQTARVHPAAPIARIETLALDRVWFGYAPARPILRGVDLTIRRGEIVALTGSGGSGKTTALRLMMGLAEPCRGRVLVNGRAPTALDPGDFRRRIALADPDQDFLPATLRAAILGARPLPPDDAIAAARLVGLDPEIAALPMGMHTLIVAGAAPDGLVQRLIIARALAARPELLLLDDVLSALEPDSCKHLLSGLRERGVTVVLTARDPALALLADRLLHFEDGRIIR